MGQNSIHVVLWDDDALDLIGYFLGIFAHSNLFDVYKKKMSISYHTPSCIMGNNSAMIYHIYKLQNVTYHYIVVCV